jgi:hypothetical protein
VLEDGFGLLDEADTPAALGRPAISVVAKSFLSRPPFELFGIREPSQVGRRKPEKVLEVADRGQGCYGPRSLAHGCLGEEPPFDRRCGLIVLARLHDGVPQNRARANERGEIARLVARRALVGTADRGDHISYPHAALADRSLAAPGHSGGFPLASQERTGESPSQGQDGISHHMYSSGP